MKFSTVIMPEVRYFLLLQIIYKWSKVIGRRGHNNLLMSHADGIKVKRAFDENC